MSLAAALSRESTPARRGSPCTVGVLLAELPDDDARDLRGALASGMQHAAIVRALASEGHRFIASTIARHRRGECACDAR